MLPSLRQLSYLKALSEQGGFASAAKALRVTQPALSTGIAELERGLEARLVERGRGPVRLTPLGEAVLERAVDILARVEDLSRLAAAHRAPMSGRLRLGLIPTIAPFVLPEALRQMKSAYPELSLYLREDQTARLVEGIRAGTLDAAIMALPYDLGGLDHVLICRDEILTILPPGHGLSRQDAITPSDLRPDELILMEDGHCLRDHALGACQIASPLQGAPLGAGFAASSLTTLVQMVGSGLGVGFVPHMAVEAGLLNGVAVSAHGLKSPQSARDIVMAWRAGSSRGAEARLLAQCFKPRALISVD